MERERVYTQPDEPIECPLCGLCPISARAAGVRPAVLTHPGWVRCDCKGEMPFNVAEELLRRNGRSVENLVSQEILQCWLEDVRRPHEPGSSGSSGRRDRPLGRDVRVEQEWAGFKPSEMRESETVEKMTIPVKGALPIAFVRRLARAAKDRHTTESRVLRGAIFRHINEVSSDDIIPIGRKGNSRVRLLLNPHQSILFQAKKAVLGCSTAELLAAILTKEWT